MRVLRLLAFIWAALTASAAHAQAVCCLIQPALTGTSIGNGAVFNSSSVALFVASNSALQFNFPFSISYGIKTTIGSTTSTTFIDNAVGSTTQGLTLLNNGTETNDVGYYFQALIYPTPNPATCLGTGAVCTRTSWINDGNRHAVTLTFDGTFTTIYIDGVQRDQNQGGFFTPNTSYWVMGAPNTPITLYNVMVHTRVLGAQDISRYSALMANGLVPNSGPLTSNLAAWWKMDACTTTCADSSGNGNTATFVSTPPSVTVTAPTNGSTNLTGTITLTATCTDAITCLNVQWQIDGYNSGTPITTSPYTATFDTTLLLDGSHTVTAIGTDPAGLTGSATNSFTTANSITGTAYYFDSVSGSDSNNCKSTGAACQTAAKIQSTINAGLHAGDSINLKNGSTFTPTVAFNQAAFMFFGSGSGVSQNVFAWASNGITVTNYGGACNTIAQTGNCPVVDNSGNTILTGFDFQNTDGSTISNIKVKGGSNQLGWNSGAGIVAFTASGRHNGFTVTNVEVQDYSQGIVVNGGFSTAGQFLTTSSVENSYIHGSTTTTTMDQGIYYINSGTTQCTIQGNLIANVGGHNGSQSGYFTGVDGNGILISNNVSHCTDQFNVTHDIGANHTKCGGPAGNWDFAASFITTQFNESYNVQPLPSYSSGCDWDGFDIDGGSQNDIVQFNYSHNNAGGGLIVYQGSGQGHAWFGNTIRYNISENDSQNLGTGCLFTSNVTNITSKSAIYNNTCYNSGTNNASNGFCINLTADMDVLIANNICMNANNNTLLHATGNFTHYTLDYNDYYRAGGSTARWVWNGTNYTTLAAFQAATGLEGHGLNVNPNFSSAGTGGTCYSSGTPAGPQPCPSGYALSTGSPMIGVGEDLTSLLSARGLPALPSTDYYGTTIPNGVGTGYNIGADGAHH